MTYIKITAQLLVILFLTISCTPSVFKNSLEELTIDSGWQYKNANEKEWSSASIPGNIHTDLLNDKLIEDPYYRLNEKSQQWIGETDWEYQTEFAVDKKLLRKDKVSLVFQGLDTYADVYLNDVKILKSDNMFRTWRVDVKPHLIEGNNKLRIYFHNVFKVNKPKYDNAEFRLQAFANNDQADVKLNLYSRKAGFHYGWDWGPRLVTAGVWRPIVLEAWNDIKIDNVYYRQSNVSKNNAQITSEFDISAVSATTAEINIKHEGKVLATKQVNLKAGENTVLVPFSIENPDLWWTNGLGEQPLYTFESTLSSKDGSIDKNVARIGIRSLEVIRDKDSFGKSMYIKLNGVPVFMKGANYIPQDNFQNRVTKEKYEHIIESAKAANMNMLRVWGGGIYEEKQFYDLCDENGLLVWQDIMFACGMYPADKDFLENVKNEVIDNVTRLQNHPSVALYCGNNENEISWYEWGWKDKYDDATQKKYEENLKTLFYKTIPEAITQVDPDRYYHPSSPMADIGASRPKENGDSHYWGVWHGKEPFANFDKNVSRFNSEYGFQSYPEFASIKKFSIEEDWDLESDVMHSHQRCMSDERKDKDYGNRLINEYLERNFHTPKDFENYVYVVQALQAKGVNQAIEAHRRKRTDNYCMGTMYWQINDCWPVASWSSIDYYGKWKALHYQVKKAYQQILISHKEQNGKIHTYVVSDQLNSITDAELKLQLLDFEGNELWTSNEKIEITSNTSQIYHSIDLQSDTPDFDKQSAYIKSSLSAGNKLITENSYFFDFEKNLNLPKSKIDFSTKRVNGGYELTINSKTLAKYVFISIQNDKVFLEDNYFDLDANSPKTIFLQSKDEIENIDKLITISSLTDSYIEQ